MLHVIEYHCRFLLKCEGIMKWYLLLVNQDFGWSCSVGKPFFSNTRQNGEWTETITRQDEKELAMFGE